MNAEETTVFAVMDDDQDIHALFTTRALAEEFAKARDGKVDEWPANVPSTKWTTTTGRLSATKKEGRWDVVILTASHGPNVAPKYVNCVIGHYSGWGVPDPKTGEYTHGQACSLAGSEDEARKMCADAFWNKVAELDPPND